MKAILSFVVVGLFVSCSNIDTAPSNQDKTIVGTWDVYQNGQKRDRAIFSTDGIVESRSTKSDGVERIDLLAWKMTDDVITLTHIESRQATSFKVEIIKPDVWVLRSLLDDGTIDHGEFAVANTFRRVKSD